MLTKVLELDQNGYRMPAKSKTPSSVDEIKSIDEQVSNSSPDVEEKVISVRIPRKEKDTSSDSHTESPKDMTKTVSSFSLLDADKKDSKESEETKDTSSKEDEVVVEDKTEITNPKSLSDDTPAIDAEEIDSAEPNAEPEKSTPKTEDDIKKWLSDVDTNDIPMDDAPKGNKLKGFLVALIVVIILGAMGGGIYYYQSNVASPDVDDQSIAVVTPTILPTPTEAPTEEVDLSALTVEILNGSGKSGLAGTVAIALTDGGFSDATAGNADASNYEETIVSMKADTPKGVYTEINKILGTDYVLELSEEPLDEDSEYDVSIVLGSSKPEKTTPTPTVKSDPATDTGI